MTETFGANLALGTLLADLSLHRPTQAFISARQRLLSLVVAPLLLLIGLYIGSYPQEHEDWMGWSLGLHNFFVNPDAPAGSRGSLVVPEGTDARRRLSALCVHLCAVAIFVSASLRELLSHRYLQWLGHHSFAVYLVHGTILRTVGVWIIYGWDAGEPWNPPGMREDGTTPEPEWLKRRGRAATVVSVIVFIILTYSAAWAWMKYVDSACARATVWLEHRLFEPKDAASDAEKGRRGATSASSSSAANGHPPAAPILGRTAPP